MLDGGDEGDVVRIEAPDVTLRGFVITGTGKSLDRENAGVTVLAPRVRIEHNELRDVLFGLYLKRAPDSVIRANRIGGKDLPLPRRGDGIRLWECPRSRTEDNVVERSRDVVLWFSDGLRVRRNVVRYGRYGLHFMYSDENILEDNRLEHNSVGAFLMYSQRLTLRRNLFLFNRGPSGFGVGLKDMDGLVAEDNVFAGTRVGLQIDNSPGAGDACAQCRMIVSEQRYAAASWQRDRGRYEARVFDDIGCLVHYVRAHRLDVRAPIGRVADKEQPAVLGPWVWPYDTPSAPRLAHEAAYVLAPDVHTPMGYGIVALHDEDAARRLAAEHDGARRVPWTAVLDLDLEPQRR